MIMIILAPVKIFSSILFKLQSFTTNKEQLVAYCGVKILLNLRTFMAPAEFHLLYGDFDQYITFCS